MLQQPSGVPPVGKTPLALGIPVRLFPAGEEVEGGLGRGSGF